MLHQSRDVPRTRSLRLAGASTRPAPLAIVAAIALTLAATVGLASRSSPWSARDIGDRALSPSLLHLLAAGAGVVFVATLLAVWAATPAPARRRARRPALAAGDLDDLGASVRGGVIAAAVLLALLAVVVAAVLPLLSGNSRAPAVSGTLSRADPTQPATTARGQGRDQVALAWLVASALLTLVALAPIAIVVHRRLGRRTEPAAPALAPALVAAMADLNDEADPRRAIVAAYSRMEQALASEEVVRARDETASEFLERVLRRLHVSASAAAELTARFEEARFSDHALTAQHRSAALAALKSVERELRAA